jgi:hypothetical protein
MGLATILKKMLMGRAFSTERGRIKLFGRTDWTMQPAVKRMVRIFYSGSDTKAASWEQRS